MKFLVFAASHRQGSYNRQLAMIAAQWLAQAGHTVDFAEYGDFDTPIYNDELANTAAPPIATTNFLHRVRDVDGLVLSVPEYNWSYPGSLKNMLDWVSRADINALKGKTALLLSASTSSRGGIQGLNHLRSPLESLQMFVFHKAFPLGSCPQSFNGTDTFTNPAHTTQFTSMLQGYVTFSEKITNT